MAGIVGGAAWWSASGGNAPKMAEPLPPAHPAARQPLLSPDEPYHGLSWQIHHAETSVEEARRSAAEMRERKEKSGGEVEEGDEE